jgi:hypothetical protein
MANVNGNWKGGKAVVKYSRRRAAKAKGRKAAGQIARNYKRYVSPSVKILKGATGLAAGAGKLALRFPGTGLVAAGLYAGAKGIAKRQKGLKFPQYRQFNKRGRKII